MRQTAVTLLLAAPSLAFAPAPFPKTERPAERKSEAAQLRECLRRLDELGVSWRFEVRDGRRLLEYSVSRTAGAGGGGVGIGGAFEIRDGNLLPGLRRVVARAERFVKSQGPGRQR